MAVRHGPYTSRGGPTFRSRVNASGNKSYLTLRYFCLAPERKHCFRALHYSEKRASDDNASDSTTSSSSTPDLPYVPGFCTRITSHQPPAPYGCQHYTERSQPFLGRKCLKTTPLAEAVLMITPRDAANDETSTASSGETCDLRILEVIAGGLQRGAQIVRCMVRRQGAGSPSNSSTEFEAVAKIYDPLYYGISDLHPNFECCIMHKADGHYSREAAAYEAIRKARFPMEGASTPEYFGSWTFQVPHPDPAARKAASGAATPPLQRPVRLVLIESLKGCSVHDLMFDHKFEYIPSVQSDYHETYRLFVWAQVLKALTYLRDVGMETGDDAPRNVMLVPRPQKNLLLEKQPRPRVVLIDFNLSVVYERMPKSKQRIDLADRDNLPQNPIEDWWVQDACSFNGWVPDWYVEDKRRRREWLLEHFGGSHLAEYVPVVDYINLDPNAVDEVFSG